MRPESGRIQSSQPVTLLKTVISTDGGGGRAPCDLGRPSFSPRC